MSSPQDAIARIQTIARGLAGIQEAPEYPPESANQFPFALTYYREGNTAFEMGWRKGLHTVFCELHVSRQVLPAAIRTAMPYLDLMLDALQNDPTLNGTVDTIVSPVTHTFGRLEFGGQENIGWRLAVTFKLQTTE